MPDMPPTHDDTRKPRLTNRQLRLHVLVPCDGFMIAENALRGGATVIQLRDKQASASALVEAGRQLRELTRQFQALLIINDRIDVALATEADGVHIGQDDIPPTIARQLLGPTRIIGLSAGTEAEAQRALRETDQLDYLGVGPIYGTTSKQDAGPAIGTTLLRDLASRTAQQRTFRLPLIAIGSITATNLAEPIAAGATGVAIISAIGHSADPYTATRAVIAAIDAAYLAAGR